MRQRTWHTYKELTGSAVEQICRGLDGDLSTPTLAGRLCVSPFYFHRIFKAVCGEGPSEMAARLRMERAASQLRESLTPITEIAFDAGFESLEGFSRSFKYRFGHTPSEFRKAECVQMILRSPNSIHWQHGDFVPNINHLGANHVNTDTTAIRIEEFPEVKVAAMRHIGPYYTIGQTFEKLCPKTPGRMFAIYHDDPESTPADKLRSDACYELAPGDEPSAGTVEATLGGGKYAVFTHVGHYMHLGASWGKFMAALASSENGIRPGPCFEYYVDNCFETPVETLRTDLYAPVQ